MQNRLRYERDLRGWSREYVAAQIGCDLKSLARWERDETSPKPYYRQRLCELFKMNAEELGLMPRDTRGTHSEGSASPETLQEDTDTLTQERPPQPNSSDQTVSPKRIFSRRTALALGIAIIGGAAVIGWELSHLLHSTPPAPSPTRSLLPGSTIYTYHTPPRATVIPVSDVEWSPQGNYIACVNEDSTVQLIAISNGTYRTAFLYQGEKSGVNSVTWSPDGTRIASAGIGDKTVQIWDPVNGAILQHYSGHSTSVISVAWSPDGTRIASSDASGEVQIWKTTTGEHILTYHGHVGRVWWVAWSHDSKYVASGGEDRTVQVWDATTGKTTLVYRGHSSTIYDVMWSPHSMNIVSTSADRTAQIWDAITGKTLLTYRGHLDSVQAAEWSPNARYIASGSADTTVQIWDVTTGKTLLTYRGHSNTVWVVTWSPDGTGIASASQDGTMQVLRAV